MDDKLFYEDVPEETEHVSSGRTEEVTFAKFKPVQ